MKKSIFIVLSAISTAIVFHACDNSMPKNPVIESKTDEKAVYTCTMHPEIHSDKPGDCPKCGMELVKMNSHTTGPVGDQSDTTKTNR
jgi:Cu(I)/Ag(I) efflux system membrane fusion protein